MVLDGVLRKHKDESINVQGLHLYNSLSTQGRLSIFCGEDEERAAWFLNSNGLTKHASLIAEKPESAPDKVGRRMQQIIDLRAQKAHIEFVIEPDPEIAAEIFKAGIPTMVYLHPQYTHPSFRPDYTSVAKPWENLTKEVDYQLEMRAEQAAKVWEQL